VGDPGGQYETIASYVDHDSLQGSTATGLSYHYADYDVERNTMYYYKVSAVWADSTRGPQQPMGRGLPAGHLGAHHPQYRIHRGRHRALCP
jgi:hypothetical protein